MTKPDMSPASIEARLDALGGLYSLGASLAAVGASIPRRVFDNRCLFVHGRASATACTMLPARTADDVALFLASAGKAHLVGDEFDLVVDPDATRVLAASRCILVRVTRQDGKPLDEIPGGEKTLAVFRFVTVFPTSSRSFTKPMVGSCRRRAGSRDVRIGIESRDELTSRIAANHASRIARYDHDGDRCGTRHRVGR